MSNTATTCLLVLFVLYVASFCCMGADNHCYEDDAPNVCSSIK